MPHETVDQEIARALKDPRRFRRRGRDSRVFRRAFIVSLLLHVSSFTLFSVVIYFPRQDIDYYEFRIVEARAAQPTPKAEPEAAPGGGELSLNGPGQSPGDDDESPYAALSPGLPPIELPRLEFAELRRYQVRQENLESRALYKKIFHEDHDDSWSRFSEGIASLRGSLRKLTGDQADPLGTGLQDPFAAPRPPETFHPASGFDGEIQWAAGTAPRRLLFSPPMEGLYDIAQGHLLKPVELVLQVNPEGRVVNVWSPSLDQPELLESLQFAALNYRFEQAPDGPAEQIATLIVREAGEGGL